MEIQAAARRAAIGAFLVLMSPRPGLPQAALYTAGDPAAATAVVRGQAVCGTLTTNMTSINGTSYSTVSASEFAALVPAIRGSVPNPMGQNTSAASAGRWDVTVVNPGRTALNVTRVDISANAATIFGAISAVQPTLGWTSNQTTVTWTGSVDVPPHSALDFIVQIAPRSQTRTANITLSAKLAS